MTIYELYDTTIKAFTVDERLRLAQLILNDAAPDVANETDDAQLRLAELIEEGLESGATSPWTKGDSEQIKQKILAQSATRFR